LDLEIIIFPREELRRAEEERRDREQEEIRIR
jgi:hypothetical protein